jgi:hypothetical protein
MADAGALHPTCRIQVVFAKWDLVVHGAEHEAMQRFASGLADTLASDFEQLAPEFYEVAARPAHPSPPFAHGVPTLLSSWLACPSLAMRPALFVPTAAAVTREIDRFAALADRRTTFQGEYDVHHA